MADKPGCYSLVLGDGDVARRSSSSGLVRRRTAEEGGSGSGFLDLSLGSIYNSPSVAEADDVFSLVGNALLPAAAAAALDASVVPSSSVVAAATAAYAPASRASAAFALGLAASSAVMTTAADGNGHGPVFVLAANPLAAASQGHVAPAPPSVLPPPLFASPVPVPPVHGNANSASATVRVAASDSGATPAPTRSKAAVAAVLGASPPSSAPPPPPPPNRKPPRGRRGSNNATGRGGRRRRGAADEADADAALLLLTNGTGGSAPPPPFPWATKTAGAHPTLAELIERGIVSVEGEVRCKRCDAGKTVSYGIRAKFEELSGFIVRNVEAMHDRAPPEWMYPALPDCDRCGQRNSLRPVIAAEKWRINWMFLLLGQTLGLCTLDQLKHFCARTRQHRTGAKDRVLYSTYMELCNQLCPGGPFDMASERKNRTRPFA